MMQPSFQIVASEALLLDWLLDGLKPMPRTRVKQLLKHGRVTVNGQAIAQFDHPLHPGDRVAVLSDRIDSTHRLRYAGGLPVVFGDDHLMVIDKPAGLLSVATEGEKTATAFAQLHAWLRDQHQGRPFVVHRLDRDTSGLLLFARSVAMRDRLQATWPSVVKTYLAVVEGAPPQAEGVVENDLTEGRDLRVRVTSHGGTAKRAVTRYRLIRSRGRFTLLEVGLETGRKHQIRVHLAGLGCPVIGDKLYGNAADPAGRLGLHAWRLAFAHPSTAQQLELESPLPELLRRVVGAVDSR